MPRVAIKITARKSGGFSARKRIPQDVRADYLRLWDKSSEEWLSIDTADGSAAKRKAQEWSADIESRIASIRAERKGLGTSLSRTQAAALAGEWYGWFLAHHEETPGAPKRWWSRWSSLLDDLGPCAS